MFFRTVTALTLSLAIIGVPQIGFATEQDLVIDQDLIIEQIDLFPDEMKSYQRSFIVTSVYSPPKRVTSIVLPEMSWPTDVKEISSDYGWRPKPCKACSSDHKGIDFVPGLGEPVYAAMDGIVSRVDYGGGFGMHVYIDHIAVTNNKPEKWQTIYAHLQKDSVPEGIFIGNIVEAGTVIGAVGNTGTSTGPHLHFEILVEGENVDPEKYLKMYAN
jgi:murein DD-endopeptidase MepM/ murein hydrolase activator NlpD